MPHQKPQTFYLKPTKLIPNSAYPLLYYKSAFPPDTSPDDVSAHFTKNSWAPQWRYSMYHRSHYHSTSHEALGVYKGTATLRFGVSDDERDTGSAGAVEIDVHPGDVIVIPAGVSHRCVKESSAFTMVGAYPKDAEQWDMNYGGEQKRITSEVPEKDPVLGVKSEGLKGLWK